MLPDIQERAAGDGGQNAVRVRRDHLSVPGDENDVGTAGLLNKGARGCIQIEILIVPLLMCVGDCKQTHGIVQPRFDMSGSVGGGTVKVGYAEAERAGTAGKIGADR